MKVISSVFKGSALRLLAVSQLCMRVKCHRAILVASDVIAEVA